MILPIYLAMTRLQMEKFSTGTEKRAFMSCHFSTSGYGLSNLPGNLPENTMLILDDSTPVNDHDKNLITDTILKFAPECVLLDFQRKPNPEARNMVKELLQALPCPVGVSAEHAEGLTCPVFLPPVPPWIPLQEHLSPWSGRDIWLELSTDAVLAEITQDGTQFHYAENAPEGPPVFHSDTLHCHYCGSEKEDRVEYYLWRTADDCRQLTENAAQYGVKAAVGVYQQFYLHA